MNKKIWYCVFFFIIFIFFVVALKEKNASDRKEQNTLENCRMWGMIVDNVTDNVIENQLLFDPISLKKLSNISNKDGWGIIYYQNYNGQIEIKRNSIRAYNDPLYDSNVSYLGIIKPKIIMVHVRHCTSGCCNHNETINDPHPYVKFKNNKNWSFSHNGDVNITRVNNLIGQEYLENNPRDCSYVCNDSSNQSCDSEHYFLLLLKYIEDNNWNVEKGITIAVNDLINAGETGGMSFLLSDGEKIWAYRGIYSLYYLYNNNSEKSYSIVASNYTTFDQREWQEIKDKELVILSGNQKPLIINISNYLAGNQISVKTKLKFSILFWIFLIGTILVIILIAIRIKHQLEDARYNKKLKKMNYIVHLSRYGKAKISV